MSGGHDDPTVVAGGGPVRDAGVLAALVDQAPTPIGLFGRDGEALYVNDSYRALMASGAVGEAGVEREVTVGDQVYLATTFALAAIGTSDAPCGRAELLLDVTQSRLRAVSAAMIELEQLKSDLVSTVSHELRTPLSSILGYCELLSDGEFGDLAPQARAMIDVISRNSQRLAGLLQNLVMLAQMDNRTTMESSWTRVDLCEVVGSVAALVARQVEASGLQVDLDLPPEDHGTLWALGDRAQLRHALMNLASNAVKFAAASGTVRFALAVDGTDAILEVVDDGVGIDPEDLPRLADRFYRTSSARTQHVQGAGIGLSVVQSVAHRHGGQLELESTPGVGTTARLRLPLIAPTAPGTDPGPAPGRVGD